ncbi:hypothetical protein M1L60_28650 [Actinoplanes sp. TRM 88003]|uniref:Uncharacterized protein n=1 Tax=Paractinoplanes aksuensis TaxID=2939490 RepID=A0ABT1DUQ4_9ACTN|nr:hypothetical protein [Actinoplanes aksuensis]MCO8274572.1 hypothetical protein [Actinoplanes aksuensis]
MILTVLVLVPTAVLFGRVWTDNSDKRSSTELELKGVEYMTALTPLVSALAESQSTGIQGVSEAPESLAAAVTRVSAADAKLGDDLRTKERWADLKDKISKLPKVTGPVNILNAHVEASDLTLALYAAVRRNAQLNRDPDGDISNLQQAVAVDMPTTVTRVNRMGDYANLLQGLPAASRPQVQAQFAHEVLTVQDNVKQLTENLQAAVDNTESDTLSGSLVSALDSFRRGVEAMNRGANPAGTPNAATMSTAQTTLQTALSNLAGITLKEMERLLDDRIGTYDYRRTEAIIMGALALLLVLGALIWPAFTRRRETEPAAERPSDVGSNRPGPYNNPYDQAPGYGELDPTRRGERSGALR